MTRHEVVGQIAVFALMIVSITGSALVLSVKYHGSVDLMPLDDGALPGGAIAAGAAVVFIGLALALRSRTAVGTQVVVSILLVAVHGLSIYAVQTRLDVNEPSDEFVRWGQGCFLIALVLQIVAALIGFVRFRRQRG